MALTNEQRMVSFPNQNKGKGKFYPVHCPSGGKPEANIKEAFKGKLRDDLLNSVMGGDFNLDWLDPNNIKLLEATLKPLGLRIEVSLEFVESMKAVYKMRSANPSQGQQPLKFEEIDCKLKDMMFTFKPIISGENKPIIPQIMTNKLTWLGEKKKDFMAQLDQLDKKETYEAEAGKISVEGICHYSHLNESYGHDHRPSFFIDEGTKTIYYVMNSIYHQNANDKDHFNNDHLSDIDKRRERYDDYNRFVQELTYKTFVDPNITNEALKSKTLKDLQHAISALKETQLELDTSTKLTRFFSDVLNSKELSEINKTLKTPFVLSEEGIAKILRESLMSEDSKKLYKDKPYKVLNALFQHLNPATPGKGVQTISLSGTGYLPFLDENRVLISDEEVMKKQISSIYNNLSKLELDFPGYSMYVTILEGDGQPNKIEEVEKLVAEFNQKNKPIEEDNPAPHYDNAEANAEAGELYMTMKDVNNPGPMPQTVYVTHPISKNEIKVDADNIQKAFSKAFVKIDTEIKANPSVNNKIGLSYRGLEANLLNYIKNNKDKSADILITECKKKIENASINSSPVPKTFLGYVRRLMTNFFDLFRKSPKSDKNIFDKELRDILILALDNISIEPMATETSGPMSAPGDSEIEKFTNVNIIRLERAAEEIIGKMAVLDITPGNDYEHDKEELFTSLQKIHAELNAERKKIMPGGPIKEVYVDAINVLPGFYHTGENAYNEPGLDRLNDCLSKLYGAETGSVRYKDQIMGINTADSKDQMGLLLRLIEKEIREIKNNPSPEQPGFYFPDPEHHRGYITERLKLLKKYEKILSEAPVEAVTNAYAVPSALPDLPANNTDTTYDNGEDGPVHVYEDLFEHKNTGPVPSPVYVQPTVTPAVGKERGDATDNGPLYDIPKDDSIVIPEASSHPATLPSTTNTAENPLENFNNNKAYIVGRITDRMNKLDSSKEEEKEKFKALIIKVKNLNPDESLTSRLGNNKNTSNSAYDKTFNLLKKAAEKFDNNNSVKNLFEGINEDKTKRIGKEIQEKLHAFKSKEKKDGPKPPAKPPGNRP